MNKIVVELCAEDRARIDKVIEVIENIAPRPLYVMEMDPEVGVEYRPGDPCIADPDVEQALGVPEPAPVRAAVPEAPAVAPVISLAEFQKTIVTRCAESAETKQKVQALISKYAACVSEVPESRRAEFLAELAKL